MTDDHAATLAPWIRTLPLDGQLLITGATLVLADVKARAGDALPAPIDEVALREERDPRRAAALARSLADVYRPHEVTATTWRVSSASPRPSRTRSTSTAPPDRRRTHPNGA
jgi:hypothetical protein